MTNSFLFFTFQLRRIARSCRHVAPVRSRRTPSGAQYGATPLAPPVHPRFDVNAVRRDFPILHERVNGRQPIWFDNAATTHKPQAVTDRLTCFYAYENPNIHRAAHTLASRATDAYEEARSHRRSFGYQNKFVPSRQAGE
ncbi:hypothetical protein QF001_004123 [Paraburkholderia youngii]